MEKGIQNGKTWGKRWFGFFPLRISRKFRLSATTRFLCYMIYFRLLTFSDTNHKATQIVENDKWRKEEPHEKNDKPRCIALEFHLSISTLMKILFYFYTFFLCSTQLLLNDFYFRWNAWGSRKLIFNC